MITRNQRKVKRIINIVSGKEFKCLPEKYSDIEVRKRLVVKISRMNAILCDLYVRNNDSNTEVTVAPTNNSIKDDCEEEESEVELLWKRDLQHEVSKDKIWMSSVQSNNMTVTGCSAFGKDVSGISSSRPTDDKLKNVEVPSVPATCEENIQDTLTKIEAKKSTDMPKVITLDASDEEESSSLSEDYDDKDAASNVTKLSLLTDSYSVGMSGEDEAKVQSLEVGQVSRLFRVDTSGQLDEGDSDSSEEEDDNSSESSSIAVTTSQKQHEFKLTGHKQVLDLDDTYLDISLNSMSVDKEARKFCKVDEVLKKSVISSGFEKLHAVPSYQESDRILQKKRKKERESTKGSKWFNLPAKELTEEVKNDLEVLQMRSVLDPKHFYKKNDLRVLPKYFQVGRVVDSAADFYHSRIPKKERKRTIVEELLADSEFKKYNKKRYKEIIEERRKTHYRAHVHAKKLKHVK